MFLIRPDEDDFEYFHDGIQREILIVLLAIEGLNQIPETEKRLWNTIEIQKQIKAMLRAVGKVKDGTILLE